MITLTREEAQQVLDALVFATPSGYGPTEVYKDSIVLLQNLLAHETPYEVGQRLHRQGRGISDIPTDVYSDGDIAEAYRGFKDAQLSQCERCGEVNPAEIHTCTPQEPEPVAWEYCGALFYDKEEVFAWHERGDIGSTPPKPLYSAPPQREWQGLTDEEIRQTTHHKVDGAYDYSFKQGAIWAEAKLKDKNI
jgi:hypothetical protein